MALDHPVVRFLRSGPQSSGRAKGYYRPNPGQLFTFTDEYGLQWLMGRVGVR